MGALASLISAGVAIFGVFVVVVQLENANDSLRAATLEQIYSRMHSINERFIDHPELRPYFYEGMKVSDPNPLAKSLRVDETLLKAQVRPTAEMMCDFFAQALIELKHLPPDVYQGWRNYIRFVYMNSPEMQNYYKDNRDWYQYPEAEEIFDAADVALKRQRAKK